MIKKEYADYLMELIIQYGDRKFFYGVAIDEEMQNAHFKSKMLLQVHDELIFDVVKEEKESLTNLVKEIMENIVKLDVPLKVGIDFGTDWYEAK